LLAPGDAGLGPLEDRPQRQRQRLSSCGRSKRRLIESVGGAIVTRLFPQFTFLHQGFDVARLALEQGINGRFVGHRSVAKIRLALRIPVALVRSGERVEVGWHRARVVDPFAKQGRPVDHVDRQLAELIFVRKIAPQIIIRLQPPDGLERQRLEPPRLERSMIVEPTCLWKVG